MSKPRKSSSRRAGTTVWFISGIIALISVFLSALLVVNQARERQSLYSRLNQIQDEREDALGEYSRLLIERWTLSNHARVHRIGETELDLVFPSIDRTIAVFPQTAGTEPGSVPIERDGTTAGGVRSQGELTSADTELAP